MRGSSLVGKPPISEDDKTQALRFSSAVCILVEAESVRRKVLLPFMFGLKMGGMAHATFMVVKAKIRPFSLAELFGICKALDWSLQDIATSAFYMMEQEEV